MPSSRKIVFFLTCAINSIACAVAQDLGSSLPDPDKQDKNTSIVCDNGCIRANADRAVQACAPKIEAQAPGDFEWIHRPYGSIFQQADAPERSNPLIVLFRGDSIRFLNPSEKWIRVIYECKFDVAKGEAVAVRTALGVLGKLSAVPALAGGSTSTAGSQVRASSNMSARPSQSQPAATATNAITLDLRRIGEPSAVNVSQIPPGTKPPRPAATTPAGQ